MRLSILYLLSSVSRSTFTRFTAAEFIEDVVLTNPDLDYSQLESFMNTYEYRKLLETVEWSVRPLFQVQDHVLENIRSFVSQPCMALAPSWEYTEIVTRNFQVPGFFDFDQPTEEFTILGSFDLGQTDEVLTGLDPANGRYWQIGYRKFVDLARGCGVEISRPRFETFSGSYNSDVVALLIPPTRAAMTGDYALIRDNDGRYVWIRYP